MDTNDGSFRRHIANGIYECYYKMHCDNKIPFGRSNYYSKDVCELEESHLEKIAKEHCLQYCKE